MRVLRRKYFRLGEKIADFVFGIAWAACRVFWAVIRVSAPGAWRAVVSISRRLKAWRRPARRSLSAPGHAHRECSRENESEALALRALQKLGLSERDARQKVSFATETLGSNPSLQDLIREALRKR